MSRLVKLFLGVMLLVPFAGAEEVEVTGRGFAESRQPPETENPPASWVSDDRAHDPEEGVAFASIHDYDLKQGARSDDKAAWRDTDYVHWFAHGATLLAQGQAQDSKSDAATIVTSEAWGGERIDVEVTQAEGVSGHIRAENTIAFEYAYAVSGPRIGEAGVGLLATAWDLEGNAHPFALSAVVGESVTDELDARGGLKVGYSDQSGGGIGLSTKDGLSLSSNGQSSREIEAEDEKAYRVTRRFAQADGDAGNTPQLVIRDAADGPTPLRRTYSVWSDGFVRLLARSADDGQTVVVVLHRFKVRNTLRAWKEAFTETGNPDGDGGPGPTTGGDDPPPPTTPDDDPSPPTTPGGDPDGCGCGDGGCGGGNGAGAGGADASIAWGETRLWARHEPARGLASERGGWPGALVARLAAPQDADCVLAVEVEPQDALDCAITLTVAAGTTFAAAPFRPLSSGPATVTLRVLDATGAPTADTLTLHVDAASLADRTEPEIWATLEGRAWRPGSGATLRALPGEDVGPLRIGRTGYADLADEATTVTLAVVDPEGILPALPPSVTIPAGELAVSLPLTLGSAPGEAVLTATWGEQCTTVTVRSEAPAWSSVPRIAVPLGAEAAIPFLVERPARTPRVVVAESSEPGRVAVEPEAELRPGEGAWYVLAWGTELGDGTVKLRSEGLPDLDVAVTVVAARIGCRDGCIELTGLDGTRRGHIDLAAPAGVRFASVALPPGAADYLEVSGLGTGSIRLSLLPSADMPEQLTLPVLFEGAAAPPLHLDVLESYETHDEPDTLHNSYRIDVR